MVAQGWLRSRLSKGDQIWVTRMEHHANYLPWQALCNENNAELKIIELRQDGSLDLDSCIGLYDSTTKLIAVTHASNVLGTINPVKEGYKLFQNQKTFFQWHKDGFAVPSGCDLLAAGDNFREQAFQYQNAYGLQFHPEVNLKMHLKWLHFAGSMLREKGAQKRMYQLNSRVKHGKKINMWLDYFLDYYLLKH